MSSTFVLIACCIVSLTTEAKKSESEINDKKGCCHRHPSLTTETIDSSIKCETFQREECVSPESANQCIFDCDGLMHGILSESAEISVKFTPSSPIYKEKTDYSGRPRSGFKTRKKPIAEKDMITAFLKNFKSGTYGEYVPNKWLFADTFGNQYLYEFDVHSLLKTKKKLHEFEKGKVSHGHHSHKAPQLSKSQKTLKHIETQRLNAERLRLKAKPSKIKKPVLKHRRSASGSLKHVSSFKHSVATPISVASAARRRRRRLLSSLNHSYSHKNTNHTLFRDSRRRLPTEENREEVPDGGEHNHPYHSIVEILTQDADLGLHAKLKSWGAKKVGYGWGTGFAIARNVILTAAHLVFDNSKGIMDWCDLDLFIIYEHPNAVRDSYMARLPLADDPAGTIDDRGIRKRVAYAAVPFEYAEDMITQLPSKPDEGLLMHYQRIEFIKKAVDPFMFDWALIITEEDLLDTTPMPFGYQHRVEEGRLFHTAGYPSDVEPSPGRIYHGPFQVDTTGYSDTWGSGPGSLTASMMNQLFTGWDYRPTIVDKTNQGAPGQSGSPVYRWHGGVAYAILHSGVYDVLQSAHVIQKMDWLMICRFIPKDSGRRSICPELVKFSDSYKSVGSVALIDTHPYGGDSGASGASGDRARSVYGDYIPEEHKTKNKDTSTPSNHEFVFVIGFVVLLLNNFIVVILIGVIVYLLYLVVENKRLISNE
eukprot:973242_1